MGITNVTARLMDKFNLAGGYAAHTADHRASPALTQLVADATKGGNHVFFGEPHLDGVMVKQYELLANNPEMFKSAAQNGVKHMVLEFPAVLQDSVDQYTGGKINRDQFKESLQTFNSLWIRGEARESFTENFVGAIDNAQAAGMKVHFADVKANQSVDTIYPDSIKQMTATLEAQYAKEKPGVPLLDYIGREMQKLPADERARLLKVVDDHSEQWQKTRMDDTEQYNYLRNRIPAQDGIIGVVGLAHLNNSANHNAPYKINSIKDYLEDEGRKVTTIEVHTTNSRAYMREFYEDTHNTALRRPDYTVNLDQRTIEGAQGRVVSTLDAESFNTPKMAERRAVSVQPAAFAYP